MRTRLKAVVSTAILEAAEQVFANVGLEAPMETIADKAGVAVGTLYNHFTDREALLHAIVDSHRSEVMRRLDAVNLNKTGPFRDRLVAAMQQIVEATSPSTLKLRVMLFQNMSHRARMLGLKPKLNATIEELLAEGRKVKALQADPDHLQATMLIAMLMSVMHVCSDGAAVPLGGIAERVVQTFLDGAGTKDSKDVRSR